MKNKLAICWDFSLMIMITWQSCVYRSLSYVTFRKLTYLQQWCCIYMRWIVFHTEKLLRLIYSIISGKDVTPLRVSLIQWFSYCVTWFICEVITSADPRSNHQSSALTEITKLQMIRHAVSNNKEWLTNHGVQPTSHRLFFVSDTKYDNFLRSLIWDFDLSRQSSI